MPDELFEGRHVPQIHHALPFEHWAWFMAHGINVNDAQHLRWMRRSDHTQIHSRQFNDLNTPYNLWWDNIIRGEPRRIADGLGEYTVSEIEALIDQARAAYGLAEDQATRTWTRSME